MVKLSVNLNKPKDSSKTDKAAQNGRTPKSLILEIHHGRWFTPTPSRSYIGGQVSSVNVVDIDEFCLYDLKDMVVKLGYGVEDLMYCHFLIPSLGLDYGLHSLNVDADVLEMEKYIKDYKIILVYVEHGSSNVDTSIFVTREKGVAIAVDNHLRKAPIEIDSSLDVNRNLTPLCHRILEKDYVEAPIVVECAEDPFEDLNDILGEYAHLRKQITGNEMENEITIMRALENKITESDVEEVQVNMNNFRFTTNPKHDTSIGGVDVQDDDPYVIDYDSFGSDIDDRIDSKRRMQLREIRRIGKQKNKGPNKYYFYLGQQFASKEIMKGIVKKHSVETRRQLILVKNNNERVRVRCEGTIPALVPYVATDNNTNKNVFSQTKGGPAIRENINSGKQNILGKDKTFEGKGKKVNTPKKVDKNSCPWTMLVTYTKNADGKFLADHVIKPLATNPDIPVRAVQDQMQTQFEVGVSNMKAFRAKRIASDIMIGSYREQCSLLREYTQELINQNPGTTIQIDVQQEPNPKSLTRTFRRVYVCLGAIKQGFRACGREILGLDGCFMSGPWPGQILTTVRVDANNRIYPVAYAIVEAESKSPQGLIQAIASVFPSAEHKYCVRHIHENVKSHIKGGVHKEMLWNAAKAISEGEFKKKMGRDKCDLLINNICEVFNRQLVDDKDQPIITCLEYIREYLMKRIMVVQQVIAKTVRPLTPSVTNMFDAIKEKATEYNVQWNGGFLYQVIGPYKDQYVVNMDKRGKLSRKGKLVSCGKCENVGHNRKGCRGQGGGSSQADVRKVSGQAAGATNVSGQAAGARKVSGQAAGATNVSGQAVGARKVSGQAAGAKKVSSQVADVRKASSQPSAAQSIAKQGPRQGF
ncbi:mutator type transposase [Tanacetum coccineum]